MRKIKPFCAWAVALTIAVNIFSPSALAEGAASLAQVKEHNYVLHCVENAQTVGGIAADGTMQIELYMLNGQGTTPNVVGGSFGLSFPKWLGGDKGENVEFVPVDTNIEITPLVAIDKQSPDTIKKDNYYAFSWTTKDGADYKNHETTNVKGITMLMGTFEFKNVQKTPSKTTISQLNWLVTDEAKPAPGDPSNPQGDPALDPFNARIYSAATKSYQVFFLPRDAGTQNPEDATLTQSDGNFLFTPPLSWKSALTIYSYDPKKQTTVEITDMAGNVLGRIVPALWNAADTTDLWSGAQSNKNTGAGAYFQSVNLDDALKVTNGITTAQKLVATANTDYKLVVAKRGSMKLEFAMHTTSNLFGEATFKYKSTDAENIDLQTIALPCGDIDNMGRGNGRTSVFDANVLLGLLNGSARATFEIAAGETQPSHYADLNGDGKISVADLNILLSAQNFNKSAASHKQTNDYGGGK